MSRIVADSWYAQPLAERLPDVVTGEDALTTLPRLIRAATRLSAVMRSMALVAATTKEDLLVTTNPAAGTRTLIALSGLLRRRNLVLLEYIAHVPGGRGAAAIPRRVAYSVLRRQLMPRATVAAHVLTDLERSKSAASHRVPLSIFHYVQWPGRSSAASTLPHREPGGRRVMVSGRRTDWNTFFRAAASSDWQITAICAAKDEKLVRSLASRIQDIRILVEISATEHDDELRATTVYVVAIPETGASIGQIRIMNAADAGTPLIISAVSGVDSYVSEDCVVQVPSSDPAALRSAVYSLLDNPALQERLRRRHFARGVERTMSNYLDEIASLVRTASAAYLPVD